MAGKEQRKRGRKAVASHPQRGERTTKAFLPKMLELNHGHIVTVASSLGLFSTAGVEDYCASKFGAIGFHESLSHEIKAQRGGHQHDSGLSLPGGHGNVQRLPDKEGD
ncbi:hypothetical protein JOQ06_027899 [Pogonophryne albipinna]|uniref:Uncharacterized protein n=1 Tax=Pogonophryne albipinna TaxID=1090488 RepID=A0AAD6F317_9TELE|nr:hypothetical protein JOQ06_027899 [Pogonophryne albipinna]